MKSSTAPPRPGEASFVIEASILGLDPEQMTAYYELKDKLGLSGSEAVNLLHGIGCSWSLQLGEFLKLCSGTPKEVGEAIEKYWPPKAH